MKKKILFFLTCLLLPTFCFATLPLGKIPVQIKLEGDLGGRVDGTSWDSNELKGKVHVLMYVDPDEKDLNKAAEKALKKEAFPHDFFSTVAVINMDASWKPDFAINSALEKKQKKFPRTIYVKDMEKTLVKKWNIKDDSYAIIAFSKKGEVIFSHDGLLSENDIKNLIQAIKAEL